MRSGDFIFLVKMDYAAAAWLDDWTTPNWFLRSRLLAFLLEKLVRKQRLPATQFSRSMEDIQGASAKRNGARFLKYHADALFWPMHGVKTGKGLRDGHIELSSHLKIKSRPETMV